MDLATREVIGYSMADHHRADLVVDALDVAASLGRISPGCIIHTDRGLEYSAQFRAQLRELKLRQSMGRTVLRLSFFSYRIPQGSGSPGHEAV